MVIVTEMTHKLLFGWLYERLYVVASSIILQHVHIFKAQFKTITNNWLKLIKNLLYVYIYIFVMIVNVVVAGYVCV